MAARIREKEMKKREYLLQTKEQEAHNKGFTSLDLHMKLIYTVYFELDCYSKALS